MDTPVPGMELRSSVAGSVCVFVFDLCNGERCRRIDALPICGVFTMCAAEYGMCSEYQRLIRRNVYPGGESGPGVQPGVARLTTHT